MLQEDGVWFCSMFVADCNDTKVPFKVIIYLSLLEVFMFSLEKENVSYLELFV